MDSVRGPQAGSAGDVAVVRDVDSQVSELTYDAGSYRDRTARVAVHGDEVFRLLTEEALKEWVRVNREPFFQRLLSQGRIVATCELTSDQAAQIPVPHPVAAILRHDRIPFISYPYEWPFSMLREAARLHLEILTEAVRAGVTLKDATPYNVQFQGSRAVFIDVGSFVAQVAGEPWAGYRQFCEMMLFPLMLQAYRQIDIQQTLRANLEGISAEQFMRHLSWRDMARSGVFTHGWLQSLLERRAGAIPSNTVSDLKSSGFTNQLIENNLAQLTRLVGRLQWNPQRTVWTNYRVSLPHVVEDLEAKGAFVREVCQARPCRLVWDLGCNDGHFSRIAASYAQTVVAMDQDHGCVERLYRELVAQGVTNILPLCIDLLNPSPAQGWRGRERRRLEQRGLPDLTLCLGLIHHLVIAGNIPLPEVFDWLASLRSEMVLEFPTKRDPMVKQLLQNKKDQYEDYSLASLEAAANGRFQICRRISLPSGERTLLHLSPKSSLASTPTGGA